MKKTYPIPLIVSTAVGLVLTTGVSGAAAATTNQPAPGTPYIADTGINRV